MARRLTPDPLRVDPWTEPVRVRFPKPELLLPSLAVSYTLRAIDTKPQPDAIGEKDTSIPDNASPSKVDKGVELDTNMTDTIFEFYDVINDTIVQNGPIQSQGVTFVDTRETINLSGMVFTSETCWTSNITGSISVRDNLGAYGTGGSMQLKLSGNTWSGPFMYNTLTGDVKRILVGDETSVLRSFSASLLAPGSIQLIDSDGNLSTFVLLGVGVRFGEVCDSRAQNAFVFNRVLYAPEDRLEEVQERLSKKV